MGYCCSKSQNESSTENFDTGFINNNNNNTKINPNITFSEDFNLFSNRTNHNNLKKVDTQREIQVSSKILININPGDPELLYTKSQLLGEGSYGTVWKVKHNQTQMERAMKIIKKSKNMDKESEKEIFSEIEILKQLDHPNIVKIYEFFNTTDAFYLLTEYCKGGELFEEIVEKGPFDENYTAFIMYQLLSALFYCQKNNIIHRDLKPENILIEAKEDGTGLPRIKIIDFGTAKIYEKNKVENRVIGSSYYIAPEVLNQCYSKECDLWSCGVIMYIMLSGKAPFEAETDDEIMEKIKLGKYDLESGIWSTRSKHSKCLIKGLLQLDVNQRYTAEQSLKHDWFKQLKTREKVNFISEDKVELLLKNLLNFQYQSKLQSTALAYLVHNIPINHDVIQSYKLFNNIDENSDGTITRHELFNGLKQLLKNPPKNLKEEVNKIFDKLDSDNNGFIEYEEFVRGSINTEQLLTDENLKFVFSYFDKDGSGEITIEELASVFGGNEKVSLTTIKMMIKQIDENGNDLIEFDEFKKMMKNLFS